MNETTARSSTIDGTRNRRTSRFVLALSLATLPLLAIPPAPAQCVATPHDSDDLRAGNRIGLTAARNLPRAVVTEAVAAWRRCPEYGIGFPSFVPAQRQFRTITVEYHLRSESTACGLFLGSRIDIFAFARDKTGRHRYCGPPALILAHELGHVLGLPHAAGEGVCKRNIMSTIDEYNLYHRRVGDDECRLASRLWLTRGDTRLAAGDPVSAG